jgi:hypothetical protein
MDISGVDLKTIPSEILANEILPRIPTSQLYRFCIGNKEYTNLCNSESLWIRKLQIEYPQFLGFRNPNMKYQDFYRLLYTSRKIPVYFNGDIITYTQIPLEGYLPHIQIPKENIDYIINSIKKNISISAIPGIPGVFPNSPLGISMNIPPDFYIILASKYLYYITLIDNSGNIICDMGPDRIDFIIIVNKNYKDALQRFCEMYRIMPNNSSIQTRYALESILFTSSSRYPYYLVGNRLFEAKISIEGDETHRRIDCNLDNIYNLLNILYRLKIPSPPRKYSIPPIEKIPSIFNVYKTTKESYFNSDLIEYYLEWSLDKRGIFFKPEKVLRDEICDALIDRIYQIGHRYEVRRY